jgi:uncharacterized protein YodC (DUF2158 family)
MAERPQFNVGDQVKLKSGGPIMTIADNVSRKFGLMEGLKCQWFAGKKLEEGHFPIDSLVIAETGEKKN